MGEKREDVQLVEALRRQQKQSWRTGERVTVECFVQRHPALQADVDEARQKSLNRSVALKMLLAGSCAGIEERARFRTEAEATGRLHHVYIVPVHEVGESAGRPYLVMELIRGSSLAQHLSGTPLSP